MSFDKIQGTLSSCSHWSRNASNWFHPMVIIIFTVIYFIENYFKNLSTSGMKLLLLKTAANGNGSFERETLRMTLLLLMLINFITLQLSFFCERMEVPDNDRRQARNMSSPATQWHGSELNQQPLSC